MGAEDLFLDISRAQIVVEVEPGLANPDDFRVGSQGDQLLPAECGVILRLMRVHTDRAPNPVMRFGDRLHPGQLVETGADRQHRPDPGRSGARDNRFALCREIREVEVAMTVDEHQPCPPRLLRRRFDEAREDALRLGGSSPVAIRNGGR